MSDVRRVALLKSGASVSALSFFLTLNPAYAGGIPSHGHFTDGQGHIRHNGDGQLTVDQNSQTGIIDWKSFSIAQANRVVFDNGHGATLNEVSGGNISHITGQLRGTGSVYLINPQGVVVSGTGRIDTQGNFAASSQDNGSLNSRNRFHTSGQTRGDVINAGQIHSSTGTVSLRGRNVRSSGTIAGEQVRLVANAETRITGDIRARTATGSGGTIIATGRRVDIRGNANLSASGRTGGIILIGGDEHGGAHPQAVLSGRHVRNARTTWIGAGATISANGTHGAGGHIVAWSKNATEFDGRISARGMRNGGGDAEVSSHNWLGFTGHVNLTARHGDTGQLLLDPYNVTIQRSGQTAKLNTKKGSFTANGNNSILKVADLQAALKKSDVVVSTGSKGHQKGDITVASSVPWSTKHSLELDAHRDITIKANVKITNKSGADIKLHADRSGTGRGTVIFQGNGKLRWGSTGSVEIFYNPSNYTHPTNFSSHVSGSPVVLPLMLVNSARDLQKINNNPSGDYALGRNIDASATANWNGGAGFIPLGIFDGLLFGDEKTISNLHIVDSTDSNVGLIGTLGSGGILLGFSLSHATIKGTEASASPYVGAVAGNVLSGAEVVGVKVIDSTVSANASGQTNVRVGGVLGFNDGIVFETVSRNTTVKSGVSGAEVGGVAGRNSGTIELLTSADGVTASGSGSGALIGGLVGHNTSTGVIGEQVTTTGTVTGTGDSQNVGGLVGENGGEIDKPSVGDIAGLKPIVVTGADNSDIGGVVGLNFATGMLAGANSGSKVYADVTAAGSSSAGGVVGENRGTIQHLIAEGSVTNTGTDSDAGNVGGVAGLNDGTVEDDASLVDVTLSGTASTGGGLVGSNDASGTIEKSFAIGRVRATGDGAIIGGLVGANANIVTQSFAGGPVEGSGDGQFAGGFEGFNLTGTVSQSYSYGWVSSTGSSSVVGGFVGDSGGGTYTDNYFATDTSGQNDGIGNTTSAGVTGETASTLGSGLPSGFDTAAWALTTGAALPYLKTFGKPDVFVETTTRTGLLGTDLMGQQVGLSVDGNKGGIVAGGSDVDGLGWSGADGRVYIFSIQPLHLKGSKHSVFTFFSSGSKVANGLTENLPNNVVVSIPLAPNSLFIFNADNKLSELVSSLRHDNVASKKEVFTIAPSGTLKLANKATLYMDSAFSDSFKLDESIVVPNGTVFLGGDDQTIRQTKGSITAKYLGLNGNNANIVLDSKSNDVGTLAGSVDGSLDFNTSKKLTIGTAFFATGFDIQGTALITVGGNLKLDAPVTGKGSGDVVVLAAKGRFTNNAGHDGIDVTGKGRYLLFINKKKGSLLGGLGATQLTGQQYAFDFAHRTYAEPKKKGDLILFP